MMKFSFDSLPEIVQELNSKIDNITMLLQSVKPSVIQNDLLSTQEAADLLGLSINTIYNKVNKKELPVMKKGKKLYFSREELQVYIKSGKVLSELEIEEQANTFLSNSKK